MRHQRYFPNTIAEQILWLLNFIAKLPGYATQLSLPPAHVDACIASCKYIIHVLQTWVPAVRTLGEATTGAVDLLLSGTGPDPVTLPAFAPDPIPMGVAAVPPGGLNRLFDLVQVIKNSPGRTDAMLQDLQIVGPTESARPADGSAPEIKVTVVQGATNKAAKLVFVKAGHQGVYIEEQLPDGATAFVAIDTSSPYMDERPLRVPGTPEVRKYRMRFWDKGTPNGDWTDFTAVTVGP